MQKTLIPLVLVLLAAPAFAQYSWIDAKGTRIFSDRPPPPGTPSAQILKEPRRIAPPAYGEPAPAAPPPQAAPATPAGPSLAERDADFRARLAKREDAERKLTQQQAAQAERCKALKRREVTLAAGRRLAEYDEKGERSFVSDEERARRLAETRKTQGAECR